MNQNSEQLQLGWGVKEDLSKIIGYFSKHPRQLLAGLGLSAVVATGNIVYQHATQNSSGQLAQPKASAEALTCRDGMNPLNWVSCPLETGAIVISRMVSSANQK